MSDRTPRPTRYRSRPQVVEAVQWIGGEAGLALLDGFGPTRTVQDDPDDPIELQLLAGRSGAQGWVQVPVGHWIVRNEADHFDYWPVDDDYFRAKYEPAEDRS